MQLEGADNSDNNGSLAFLIPSAEAIETVSVTTSNYNRIWSSTLVQYRHLCGAPALSAGLDP